jgi:transketolase
MSSFGESGKIADVYQKFGITVEAVVRAAHESISAA